MSATTTPSDAPSVQWLIESRPPSLTWSRPTPPQPNQPPLDLDHRRDYSEAGRPTRGVRVTTVKARWMARPRADLPDAQQWSTTLALAFVQALVGQRPAAQPRAENVPWMVRNLRTLVAGSSYRVGRTRSARSAPRMGGADGKGILAQIVRLCICFRPVL